MTLTERHESEKPSRKAKRFTFGIPRSKGLACTSRKPGQSPLCFRIGRRIRSSIPSCLARVGELSLIEARQRATRERLAIRDGESSGPLAKRQAIQEAPTFADLWQRFLDDVVPERLALGRFSKKSLSDYSKIARLYLLPVLGTLRVKDIVRA